MAKIKKINLNSAIVFKTLFYSHGGKIGEKANARICFLDTVLLCQPFIFIKGIKLNSLCLKNGLNIHRSYSSSVNKSRIKTYKQKERKLFQWPDYKSISEMYADVENKQVELVKLADIHGINETKVLNYQLSLFRSYRFRIIAILNLFNSKGCAIPGSDGEMLKESSRGSERIRNYIKLERWLRVNSYQTYKYKRGMIKMI